MRLQVDELRLRDEKVLPKGDEEAGGDNDDDEDNDDDRDADDDDFDSVEVAPSFKL